MNMFTVGVQILLNNSAFMRGMQSMSRAVSAAGIHMGSVNNALSKFQSITNQFSALKGFGDSLRNAGLGAIQEVIDPAKEYVHQLNLMNMNGMEHIQQIKNIETAWKTARDVSTSTPTGNLRALMDLRTIFGGNDGAMDESRHLLPKFMRTQAILDASSEELKKGTKSSDIVFSMAKAIEMMGKIRNPQDFEHHMDMMTRVMVATHGRVRPEDYQQLLKFSPQGKMLFSEDFLYKMLPELILENKGGGGGGSNAGAGRVGTMTSALLRLGVQGIISRATASNLLELGLLNHPTLNTTTTGTTVKGQEGVKGKELLGKNPAEWVNKVLIPTLKAKYPSIAGNEEALMMKMLGTFKGNSLAVGFMLESFNKRFQMAKFGKMLDATPSSEELYKQSQKDPDQAFKAFDKSLETLKTAIGQHLLPVITPGIIAFSNAIAQVGQYVKAHPIAGQVAIAVMGALAIAGAVISGVAIFGGLTIALGALGIAVLPFLGWVAAGIAVIGGGIIAFMRWNQIVAFGSGLINKAKAAFVLLLERFPFLQDWIIKLSELLKRLGDATAKAFTAVLDSVGQFLKGVAALLPFTNPIGLAANLFNMARPDLNAKIAALANSKDLDARLAKTLGAQQAPGMLGGNVKIDASTKVENMPVTVHGDAKDIDKAMQKALEKHTERQAQKAAQAVKSHTVAGGTNHSWAHTGAH